MTAAEIIPNVKTLNRQDLDTLRKSVEERHETLRTQEVAGLFKTVLIGTWASYMKSGNETVGEVVSTNKKAVVINFPFEDKMKRKSIPWGEVHKTYQSKPDVSSAPPQKPKLEVAAK